MRSYNERYKDSDIWTYTRERELPILRRCILAPAGVTRGDQVLEIGCGAGFHTWLMGEEGLDVIGVDIAPAAIERARRQRGGPHVLFRVDDVSNLPAVYATGTFALILARGMSYYHYELLAKRNRCGIDVIGATRRLMPLLRPGGCFCLQIGTDFSGTDMPSGIRGNTLSDYRGLMAAAVGPVIHECDWAGNAVSSSAPPRGGIIIVARTSGGTISH